MSGSFQYNHIDSTTARLSKIQEYLEVGLSSTLEIALDIEEGNSPDDTSKEVEKLKDLTVEYVQMEKELGQWLKAAELTKEKFKQDYNKAEGGEVPDIEEILLSNLNEIENTSDGGDLQQHPKVQEFAQQVWNVHHSGQPLPNSATNNGRDEDIIIAQAPEESIICPLTRKEMVEPVRSKKCSHSYEKTAIVQHIKSRLKAHCPVAGCAHFVTGRDLEPNSSLAFRIKRLQRKR